MECKGASVPPFAASNEVLIETLWNVKDIPDTTLLNVSTVLIETLWNVKRIKAPLEEWRRRVLIETLWNVK